MHFKSFDEFNAKVKERIDVMRQSYFEKNNSITKDSHFRGNACNYVLEQRQKELNIPTSSQIRHEKSKAATSETSKI